MTETVHTYVIIRNEIIVKQQDCELEDEVDELECAMGYTVVLQDILT